MTLLRSLAFNVWFYGLTLLFCLAAPVPVLLARLCGRHVAGRYGRAGHGWRWSGCVRLRASPGASKERFRCGGPVLLAAQHQSAFETVLWAALLPDVCFVVKRELMRLPLFGAVLRASDMIGVDRAGGALAMRAMLRAGERAAADGRQIVIFPEGTRVEPGTRAKLHPGIAALAARTGLPVIPVVTDSGRHWGRNAFQKHSGTIRVRILPALPAGLPRDELLRELASVFAAGPEQ